ncbi:9469_t:CDS:2 [Entrophospora sp. SA101]|nr:9469_t:CDS:2 [Entrophospora sp. SA101]
MLAMLLMMQKVQKASEKTREKNTSKFTQFGKELKSKLDEAINELVGEDNGVINNWATEMKEIHERMKRKGSEHLERDDESIKKLKLDLENNLSSKKKFFDDLSKFDSGSQRFHRKFVDDLTQLRDIERYEIDEKLKQFTNEQDRINGSLLRKNKECHNISKLKKHFLQI